MKTTAEFQPGRPWLLRFFDQIRFYPVEAGELMEMRDNFLHGKFHVEIGDERFRLREYHAFLESVRPEAEAFKRKQQGHSKRNASAGAKAAWIGRLTPRWTNRPLW